jgi:hypothetical protein
MAQTPVAVVADVSSISGMWPWCTVITAPIASRRNAMNRSAPDVHLAARFRRVHHDVVGEHLAHGRPVLRVHGAEVPRLEPLDRFDVVHGIRRR